MELTSISSDQFTSNTKLRFLSMGWNNLAEIPTGVLDGLDSLTEVRLYDTSIECSCDNLWFVTYTQDHYISLYGDILCANGDYESKYHQKGMHDYQNWGFGGNLVFYPLYWKPLNGYFGKQWIPR